MRSFYGVTLVELVVSVATVCILSATVVPAFTSIIRSNEIHTTISKLRQGLYFARQSALLEDGTVVICKSATGSDCTGSGDWNQGWLIFQDRNDDGQCVDANDDDQCDEDEGRLLRVASSIGTSSYRLIGNSHIANRVKFNYMGGSPGYNGTISLCKNDDLSPVRGLIIANTGRVRITRDPSELDCGGG